MKSTKNLEREKGGQTPRATRKPKPWIAEHAISAMQAQVLIEKQFPQLAPASIHTLGDGWDNTAFLVNRTYVFRFPRRHIAVQCLETELRVLPEIAASLPVAIPMPVFAGQPEASFPWPFSGYEILAGTTACHANLDETQRQTIAVQLAHFLKSLHCFSPPKAAQIGAPPDLIGRLDFASKVPELQRQLDELHRVGLIENANRWHALLEATAGARTQPKTALVHGDLYMRHLLVDAAAELSGVIDWGDVHLGDPALDLSIVYSFLPPTGRDLFWRIYGDVDADTLRLAQYRALHYAIILLRYGHSTGDRQLVRAGRIAFEYCCDG